MAWTKNNGIKGDIGPTGPASSVITVNGVSPNAEGDVVLQLATTWENLGEKEAHTHDEAPHQYGNKFEWRYNAITDSLDLVVLP